MSLHIKPNPVAKERRKKTLRCVGVFKKKTLEESRLLLQIASITVKRNDLTIFEKKSRYQGVDQDKFTVAL